MNLSAPADFIEKSGESIYPLSQRHHLPKVLPTDPDAIRDIYNAASFATADHTCNSEEAEAFVAELKAMTLAYEARNHPRGRARRKTDDEAFKMAIAAFAADLVRHSSNEASYGFMYRPADREELAQTLVSSDALTKLRTYWIPLGLLEESGFTWSSPLKVVHQLG